MRVQPRDPISMKPVNPYVLAGMICLTIIVCVLIHEYCVSERREHTFQLHL